MNTTNESQPKSVAELMNPADAANSPDSSGRAVDWDPKQVLDASIARVMVDPVSTPQEKHEAK